MPPQVVVIPGTSSGHCIPFLQFARRLASVGVVTTLVSTDRHVEELQKMVADEPCLRLVGLRDNMAELSHHVWRRRMLNNPEEREQLYRLLREVVTDLGSPHSQQLRGVAPASPPVAILYDLFTSWAQEATDQLPIETHLLYVSAAVVLSADILSLRLFREGRVPVTRETRELIFTEIPGLPPTLALDLPSPWLAATHYNFMRKHYERHPHADTILINTFYDIEKRVLDALRSRVGLPNIKARKILEIGPLLPESYVNEDRMPEEAVEERDPCILWLNKHPPQSVLYISFGSSETHSASQLLELANGLEASGCAFLWLVRAPNAGEISAASDESPPSATEYLPPDFKERMKDRGLCYPRWAPQTRILKHPAVGGFMSHCGWNSTLEAMCAGVPMLAWPLGAEQHPNRRFLVDSVKVAIDLVGNPYTKEQLEGEEVRPKRSVSREEIEEKVRRLMQEAEGKVVRQNMQGLRRKAREAGAPGGSSRTNFETYVQILQDLNAH